jgi:hypothetical protein
MRGLSCVVLARQRAADRLASTRWAYIRASRPLPIYRTTPSTTIAYTYADRVSERGLADACTWIICPQLTLYYLMRFLTLFRFSPRSIRSSLPHRKTALHSAPSEFAETPFEGCTTRGSRAAQARLLNPWFSATWPSSQWLGLSSPKKIRESGLWLVNELHREALTDIDLGELKKSTLIPTAILE